MSLPTREDGLLATHFFKKIDANDVRLPRNHVPSQAPLWPTQHLTPKQSLERTVVVPQLGLEPGATKKQKRFRTAWCHALRRLEVSLARLPPSKRRLAIERLPHRVRLTLLGHMTSERTSRKDHSVAEPVQRQIASGAKRSRKLTVPLTPRVPRAGGSLKPWSQHKSRGSVAPDSVPSNDAVVDLPPKNLQMGGVRTVPTGLFQAFVNYKHLVMRSRICKTREEASKLHSALRRMCELAEEAAVEHRPWDDCLRLAFLRAPADIGIPQSELRPSFGAYLSTGPWAGRIESPTTTSLEQAILWRARLLAARNQSWQMLRNTWVAVLQETRLGSSTRLSAAAAEQRVTRAWDRQAWRRANALKRSEARLRASAKVDPEVALSAPAPVVQRTCNRVRTRCIFTTRKSAHAETLVEAAAVRISHLLREAQRSSSRGSRSSPKIDRVTCLSKRPP